MVEVRNIAFTYKRKAVLRDVSFVVSPGETVSIVGANGAGKTTLMRILATLAVPDSGQVLLDGQDALAYPIRYRKQLGYMQEEPALYEDMTVKGYLKYRARLKGEMERRIRRRISEAVELCGLANFAERPICQLSVGQKKRVALADAVLLRPRVILLDDFLAGMDLEMREATTAVLTEVAAFSSVIVTGHELHELVRCSTRFLVLQGGVISSVVPAAGVAPEDLIRRVEAAIKGGG